MILKKNKYKIATILPYKESYTLENASAVSLWVSEFFSHSKFKDNNIIFGSSIGKNYLSKNYNDIKLKSINNRFKSTSNEYINKLFDKIKCEKLDIVEIHNRPLVLEEFIKKFKINYIFYFHNDPLSMSGSKTTSERIQLLKNVSKIIFISNWVKNRFFIGLENQSDEKTDVIYHSIKKINPIKKKKIITFVGKLNESKGYDLFKEAITKILDKYPNWSALSVGNESRRNIYISHARHKELGFLNHKETLKILNKSEIAVVPSKWEEPFGRVAQEATACGCATIISNRGGLPETSDYCIIIKNINSSNLYKEIEKLIKNQKRRKKIQNLSRQNIKHKIIINSKKIDLIRANVLPKYTLNIIKKRLRIINLFNQGQKSDYRLYNISLGKKFTNGFIRNNHDVLEISDRDFIKKNRPFNMFSNKKNFQQHLINTFNNYKPDLFFFGHTNNIDLTTLEALKLEHKNLIISQWNEDPMMKNLSFSSKNIENIKKYSSIVDHNFSTTHPSVYKHLFKNNNFHFFFVPVDRNIEKFDVYNLKPNNDIFYAMSHGVNRAILKKGFEDDRIIFLNKLIKKIPDVRYDFRGFKNKQPIWGNDFNNTIINSKMGLNLSRGKPTKYYSSNRVASILGNGLLTFIDKQTEIDDFFTKNEVIFYENIDDLASKIKFYSKNDLLRKKIARNGKNKYFKLFDGNIVSKYIVDISLGKSSKLF